MTRQNRKTTAPARQSSARQRRKALSASTRSLLLHECGYRCSNPACRMVLTLDIHHIEYVAEGGGDSHDNLLPLCPNCHALHHQGHIPRDSLRTWKLLLLALNEGFDRRSVDTLLALDLLGSLMVWGDALLNCAALVASGFLKITEQHEVVEQESFFLGPEKVNRVAKYRIELSSKGLSFVAGWKRGDQEAAVSVSPSRSLQESSG
jgi:hypothetical protein